MTVRAGYFRDAIDVTGEDFQRLLERPRPAAAQAVEDLMLGEYQADDAMPRGDSLDRGAVEHVLLAPEAIARMRRDYGHPSARVELV